MSTAGSLRPFSNAVHPPRDEHGHLQRVHPRRRESRSTTPGDNSNLAAATHGAPVGIFSPAAAQRERDARRVDLPKSDGHARRHGSHPRRSNDRRMAGFAFALEGRGDLGMATEVTPAPSPHAGARVLDLPRTREHYPPARALKLALRLETCAEGHRLRSTGVVLLGGVVVILVVVILDLIALV